MPRSEELPGGGLLIDPHFERVDDIQAAVPVDVSEGDRFRGAGTRRGIPSPLRVVPGFPLFSGKRGLYFIFSTPRIYLQG